MHGPTEIVVMPVLAMDTMTGTGTMKANRMSDRVHLLTAGMLSDGLLITPILPGITDRITDPSGGGTIRVLRLGGTETAISVRMPNHRNGITAAITIRPIRSGQPERVMFSPLPYLSPVCF